jgi:hypothetical protein
MPTELRVTDCKIVFCCVDDTDTYNSTWIKGLIKNQADYTISNIYQKGYSVLQGKDEDKLLIAAVSRGYKHAVVFSPGTEFVNGFDFFNEIELLATKDYFLAGHVLDRKTGYYELHHQCYLINLEYYQKLDCPMIGKQQLGFRHTQLIPNRSDETWHDDYTPKFVWQGKESEEYEHRCHGWNILSLAFSYDYKVLVFDELIRNSKRHYYPESHQDFLKQIQWAYHRQTYCVQEFIHTSSNERANFMPSIPFRQVVTPASGIWYDEYIDTVNPVTVIFYDYNQKALDYWQEHAPKRDNVTYKFVQCDLLSRQDFIQAIDTSVSNTLINLSNIFNYEATTFFYSLEYRIHLENQLLDKIRSVMPNVWINFSARAATGYINSESYGKAIDITNTLLAKIKKLSWHTTD